MSKRTKEVKADESPFSTLPGSDCRFHIGGYKCGEPEPIYIGTIPEWAIEAIDSAHFDLGAESALSLGNMQESARTKLTMLEIGVHGLLTGKLTAEQIECTAADCIARILKVVELARPKAGIFVEMGAQNVN